MARWLTLAALAVCAVAVATAVVADAAPAAAPKAKAAAAATAGGATACVLTLPIEQKASPFTLVGSVSKPFNATVTPIKATATGNIYLRLPTDASAGGGDESGDESDGGACPDPSVWANADAAADLLSRATLVQPAGKTGVRLLPAKMRASVRSVDSGDEMATYTLTDFAFGLEGNGPLGGVAASPAAASASVIPTEGTTDAEVVVLKGGLVIDSTLTGERTATLASVAQNVSFASGAAPVGASSLGVVLRDVKWSLAVGPKTTPGILFTEAKVGIEGDIVASAADLAKAAAEVSTKDLRLRCSLRVAGPVIEGGEEPKPDLVKRQKKVTGGCPDEEAAGPAKAKAAAAEADEAEADVAAAAAAEAGGEEEAESKVDRAVKEAYGSGAAAAHAAASAGSLLVALAAAVLAA